jgi:hypothetical protein
VIELERFEREAKKTTCQNLQSDTLKNRDSLVHLGFGLRRWFLAVLGTRGVVGISQFFTLRGPRGAFCLSN